MGGHDPSNGFSTEPGSLEIVKPDGPLNVGQGCRVGSIQDVKDLARYHAVFEVPDEFLEVVLHHPPECHQIEVHVVYDLNFRRLFFKEHPCCTAKRLHIGLMLREHLNNLLG